MSALPLSTADTARIPVPSILRAGGFEAEILPDPAWRGDLGAALGLSALRKLRLTLVIDPSPGGLTLTGHLGATVVQPCVVTLAPVTTRIEAPVARTYQRDLPEPESEEVEIPEDDSLEPLGEVIDLAALLAEVLALNLPLYPRADGAELGAAVFAPEGAEPLSDEEMKPFAGLQGLKDKISGSKPPDDGAPD